MGAGGGEEVHPEWLDQRQLAQIAKLTPDQQAEAKKELADRKTLFAEMAKLSAEEKRSGKHFSSYLLTLPTSPDKIAL